MLPIILVADAPPDVPAEVRTKIAEFFSPTMVDPGASIWRYTAVRPFFGGHVYCGTVNAVNSIHQYLGIRPWYATVYPDGVREGAVLGPKNDDPIGGEAKKYHLLCD